MPDFDPVEYGLDMKARVNARAEQAWHDSPVRKAGAAVVDFADRAGKPIYDAVQSAKERFFPARPDASGPGRDVQLPRDRYSKRNFDPNRERKR